MKELTITEIENIKVEDVKNMEGEFKFNSTIQMGYFLKKVQCAKRDYIIDYKLRTITL